MNNYIIKDGKLYNTNELMHYGIPGMKWGKRKTPEYEAYRKTKKEHKKVLKETNRDLNRFNFGVKGIDRYNRAMDKRQSSEMNMISAKAKYKASKAKDKLKADKAEQKVYKKELMKTGLPGSGGDKASEGRSTRIYNTMVKKKGKKYADAVTKKAQNAYVGRIAGSAAVLVGAAVVSAYLDNR